MFVRYLVCASLVLTLSSEAFGKSKKRTKRTQSDEESASDSNRRPDDNSGEGKPRIGVSAANRVGKKFMAVGEIALVDILQSGFGAEGGFYLKPNTLVEVGYLSASFAFLGYKSEHTLLTAEYHQFTGNSFYFFGGGGLSTLTSKGLGISTAEDTFFDTYSTSLSQTSVIVQGGIGNRWQFSALTIGCDWVAYALPLFKLSSSSSFGENASDADKAKDQASFDTRAKRGVITNVRFHIGASF